MPTISASTCEAELIFTACNELKLLMIKQELQETLALSYSATIALR